MPTDPPELNLQPEGNDAPGRRSARRLVRKLPFLRHLTPSVRRRDDRGLGLIEAMIALALLASSVAMVSNGIVTSLTVTHEAQNRAAADQIASETIQEVEDLGYSTAVEGIDCTVGTGAKCTGTGSLGTTSTHSEDPNHHLHYTSAAGTSTSCWYYGTTGHYLVPTIDESALRHGKTVVPIIPYVSGSTTDVTYPNAVENGITYKVSTYPMFNLSQYTTMSCKALSNGSDPTVPLTVLVEVSWTNHGSYHVDMSGLLYSSANGTTLILNGGAGAGSATNNCQGLVPGAGAHTEALIGFQSTVAPQLTTVNAGSTASMLFMDEQPTPTAPSFCVLDSTGKRSIVPVTVRAVTYYGSGPSNPFLKDITTADDTGGSGPNAEAPPTGGSYCQHTYSPPATFPGPATDPPTSCDDEVRVTFSVPRTNPSDCTGGLCAKILALTIAVWDHEQDLDVYTWKIHQSLTGGTPPLLTTMSPDAGPIVGGNHVLLHGHFFTAGASVKFGATTATTAVVLTPTLITVVAPPHAVGAVTVIVTTTAGSSTRGKAYNYDPVPTLTKVSPVKGTTLGKTQVILTGTGFEKGTTSVGFVDNTPTRKSTPGTTAVWISSTQVQVVTPAHATGQVTVVVHTPGGTSPSGYSYTKFTFIPPPTIAKISPDAGSPTGGNTVTLTGTRYTSGAKVSFGGTLSSLVTVTSLTQIKAKVPAHARSTVTVTVTTTNGISNAVEYAYGGPTVTKVTPPGGKLSGGTTVTLTGAQFVTGATVSFGGHAGTTVVVVTPTKLTVRAPAHVAGAVTVTVTTPAGTSGGGEHYTYYTPPTLTSVTPTGGKTAGGNRVTLRGINFVTGATVTFGTAAGTTVVVVNSTTITVTAPTHRAATVTVTVKTYGGTSSGKHYTYYPVPVISKVTPSAGPLAGGTTVTLSGSGFVSASKVVFGASTATSFSVVNTTTIRATAPAHAKGAVTVTVTTTGGTSGSGATYTYDAAPKLTKATPNGGSTAGGTLVTLTGSNFGAGGTVSFGGKAGTTVTTVNTTTITVKSPAHTFGVVSVTVTTPGGTTTPVKFVFGPPSVSQITPGAGTTAGGTPITITGTGFITGAKVKFATTTATTVVVVSSTSITAKSPAHAAGTVTVVVHTAGGTSTAVKFYYGAPTLTAVTPNAGSTQGGTPVTLTGTKFATGAKVKFGTATATTVVVVSSTTITAKIPKHTAGTVTVKVTTGGGTSGGVTFTYNTVPVLTAVTPDAGKTTGGTAVTLTGNGFLAGVTVKFGTAAATTVVRVSSTKITVKTPVHVAGTVTVTVKDSGGTSNGLAFVFGPATLTAISPTAGKIAGGTSVTLTGTGFVSGATVSFGGKAATTVVVATSGKITAKTPTHTHTSGTVSVTVTTAGGTSGSVSYTYDPVPTVTGVTPATGYATGGTSVTVNGTGFAGPATVTFGGKAATTVVVSTANKITAKIPVHSPGTVTVVVTTPGGSASGSFRYVVPTPTISSFTPTQGSTTGSTTVTITGTNFSGTGFTTTGVKFGTTAATSYTVTSSTTIKAVTGSHAQGTVTVKVTTAGGTATAPSDYKFVIPAPTITSFTPTTGLTSGTTTVTITGTNFSGTTISLTSVKFGSTTAKTKVVVNSTTITVTTKPHAAGTVQVKVTTSGGTATAPSDFKFVVPLPTTTTLTSSADPSQVTQSVTYTATVAGVPSGTPSAGTVKFYTGGTQITCTSSTSYASGTATCKVKYTTTNTGKSITAKFTTGDVHYKSSTSSVLTQVIDAAPTVSNVAVETSETTKTATSASFTSTSGASYIIFADHTSSAGDSATLSSTGSLKTIQQITAATNAITVSGARAGTDPSWQWAWYATGTGSAGTVTATFTKASTKAGNPYNLIQVVKVTGVDVTNPVTGATLTQGKTTTKKAAVTLSSSSTSTQLVNLYVGGDMGGAAPTWSPATVTNITGAFQHNGGGTTGDGETTATAVPGLGSATAGSTSGPSSWPATNTDAYGAVDLQLRLKITSPTITSFTQTSGTTSGGTTVTITGTHFTGGGISVTSVKFGTTAATSYTVTSSTTIKAVTPVHVAGTVSIKVTTSGGTATSGTSYRFVAHVPTITTFSPTIGPTTGATSVTITGTDFIGATAVEFGTTAAASYTVTSSTTIKAVTEAHAAGTVQVYVTTAGGTGTIASHRFTYGVPAPAITSFTPVTGVTTGGTTVTITGTSFSGKTISVSSVTIGTGATVISITSSTTMKVKTRAHAAGTVPVTVITTGGTATAALDYKFVAPVTTTTTLTSSADPIQVNGGVTYTATVSGVPSGTPSSGTVTFKTGTANITCGSGSASFSSGIATCKVSYASASTGKSIKAIYSGSGKYLGSTSSVLTQVIDAVPTVTDISNEASETTKTAVSSSFTSTSGASYIIFADHTSYAGDSATLSSTGSLKTIHPITAATNSITVSGATAGTDPSWQWAWYATGTGSAGTMTATFAKTRSKTAGMVNPYNLIQVVKVTGVDAGNPVTGATLTKGKSATKKASVTLSSSSTALQLVNVYLGGDMGGPTPGWSPSATVTKVASGYQHSGSPNTGDAEDTATATAGLGSATIGTGNWPATNGDAYGAVDLQLRLPLITPTITSFSPSTGPVAGGTTVTITGTNFTDQGLEVTSVKFGTTAAASYTVTSPTTIKAVTPAHGAGTVTVKVAISGSSVTASTDFKFVAAPVVTSFTPSTGATTGGTTVTITGGNFTGATSVTFGTTAATSFSVTNSTKVKAKTKPHTAATVVISVTTAGGTGRSTTDFTFKALPTITGFTPSTGPAGGGTAVTLTGSNFTGSSVVIFGGATATLVSFTSPTSIKVTTPIHSAGTVVVKVTTTGGIATASSDYKYVAAPTITSFTPSTGATTGGTTVTITGTNLSGASSVKFGTTAAASYTVTSSTTIKAKTEAHLAGTVVVSATTIGGTADASSDFKYLAIPTVTALTPSTGSTSGGTTVVITGTNLTTATAVKFGATAAASYTITGPTKITAVTKPHLTGTVSVSVRTPVGTAYAPSNFTFIAPTPAVSSFSPSSGTTSGGTTVAITGTGFFGASAVKFGTTTATSFIVTSPTQVTAVTKPHAAGTVTIQVTTPGGSGRSAHKYKFTAPVPTISSVTPGTGSGDGGTSITITGTGLYGATQVTFVTKTTSTEFLTATSFTVTSPTTVVAVTPPHAPGTVTVDVTTAGGTAIFSYYKYVIPVPTITSISPATGTVTGGTTVTLKGSGFTGPDFAVSRVTFGTTTAATFTVTGPTTITAKTFPHVAGTVPVEVTNPSGTATSPTDFKFVIPAPTITSFTPSTGPTTGGTTVAVTGTHFTAYGCGTEGCGQQNASAVKFGTTNVASFSVTSGTKITAITGAHHAGTFPVKVTTAGGTATSSTGFAFLPPVPTITSFSPTMGPASGGTTVTITGTNFEGTRFTTTKVKFGSTTATSFTVTSPTTITAKTKAHSAGTITVSVVTVDRTATSSTQFRFVPAPTISSFTPTAGKTSGGTTVTITGTNFKGATYTTTSMKFGTTAATSFTVTSASTITAKTKAHAAGTVTISLVTPGGTANSATKYAFVAAPVITHFTPTAGKTSGGTTVTITGSNFKGTGYTTTSVKFGTTAAASFTVTSATTITAKTKAHAAGTVTISVVTPGGTANSATKYTFVAAPVITHFTPTAGKTSGGTTVTITGSNFKGTGYTTTSVKFGTTAAASFTVTSATTITAKTKAHAAGTVTISLVTPGGTANSATKYTFVAAPVITHFTPTAGKTSGGTTVTITGSNFKGTSYTTTSVKFGTTAAASFTVTSATTITAKTKAHAAGTVTISVVTPGGTANSATKYTFVAAPVITHFTPTAGKTSGGTTVTITGSNFKGTGYTTTSVKFGTTAAASFTVTSATTITAKTKAHAAGTVTISVVTPGGTANSATKYTFVAAPVITHFTPTAGKTSGGTTVTITGSNFKGTSYTTTSVKFGTTAAASFTVTSATTITAKTKAHAAGTVTISVVTPGGTANSATKYTFVAAPVITHFTPTAGKTAGGTTVTITGTHFSGAGYTTTSVKFGTTAAASFTVTSATTITAKTKAHAAGTVTISVVTPGGTANSATKYTFYTQLTLTAGKNTVYVPAGTTSVTYTVYGAGGAGGEATGATGGAGGNAAKITGKIAFSSNPTGITLTVLVGSGGSTSTTVTGGVGGTCGTGCGASGGSAGKNSTSHKYASGGGGAGSIIQTSTGTDLVVAAGGGGGGGTAGAGKTGGTGGAAGVFSGSPASSAANTGTSGVRSTGVKTCTHAGATGGAGGGGKTGTTPFNATGGCKGLADTMGPGGGHRPGTQGLPTTAGAGPGAGGAGGNSSDGASGAGGGGGWAGGGGGGGANTGGSSGGGGSSYYKATTTVGSITITTTATATLSASGTFGVGGASASNGKAGHAQVTGASIKALLTPTVSSFSPPSGASSGGTSVAITGTNFNDVTAVKFGTTVATHFTVTSSTTITAKTKSHAVATVTVSVTNPVGTGTSSGHYSFVAAPTVGSFSPPSGSHSGGTTVTITGSNFLGTGITLTSVKFGTSVATHFTVESASQIKATAPSHTTGSVHISVVSNGGTGTSSGTYGFS